jgi:hypothetical protein
MEDENVGESVSGYYGNDQDFTYGYGDLGYTDSGLVGGSASDAVSADNNYLASSQMYSNPFDALAADNAYMATQALTPEQFRQVGSFYNTAPAGFYDSVKNFFKKPDGSYDFGKMAALGTGLASMTNLNKAGKAPVGYQGGIPEYKALQQQIPRQADPARVPGSAGQRYFTDMQYAAPADVAAKQGIMSQQAQEMAQPMATGGLTALASGKYLRGHTDGMADEIPAKIGKDQPAKLSHGEFVIPADVVSHLGNGNSDAGANVLYAMMAKVRKARTGTDKQGKKINPEKFTPGGGIKGFAAGGSTGVTGVGSAASSGVAGTESNLSNYAGPYVTGMLGKGEALSETPYQAYTGPLTAGASDLQTQAFGNAASLNVPTGMGGYTPGTFDTTQANKYMNPYLSAAMNPVLEEQRRQAEIGRVGEAARYTKAGSFGGGRQAIADTENTRNLGTLQNKTLTEGYKTAYDKAMDQFNKEQGLGLQSQDLTNRYGLAAIEEQAKLGGTQRDITAQGIAADKAQFEEERADPFKKVQFQQSLLQNLPLATQSYTPAQTSALQDLMATGSMTTAMYKQLQDLGVIEKTPAPKA